MTDVVEYITNKRKSITKQVYIYFREMAKDEDMICPYCKTSLYGSCDIAHVIPVIKFGDAMPTRRVVGMHYDCNVRLSGNVLDLQDIPLENIIICDI